MGCSGRYAEAWQFAAFFCIGSILAGKDDSGGLPAHPYLSCSYIDFESGGVKAGKGMVAYNLTKNTSGVVIDVVGNTLQAVGVTWDDGDSFRVVTIDAVEIATIEHYLDVAASDIHAALAASGQCDCTMASWASEYLAKLNIIDASVYHVCKCAQPTLSDEQRQALLEWMSVQMDNLRQGKVDVCSGSTGAEFPAIGWAQQSITEFSTAQIIYNARRRYGS